MPTSLISGFVGGDTIDLAGIAFTDGGVITLEASNQLSVDENDTGYSLQLNPAQNFSSVSFLLSPDGSGGVDVTAAQSVAHGQIVSGASLAAGVSELVSGTAVSITINSGGSEFVLSGASTSTRR